MERINNNARDTANLRYFDASLRHQIGVQHVAGGQVRELADMQEQADKDFAQELAVLLLLFVGKPLNVRSKKYQQLIQTIRRSRNATLQEAQFILTENLRTLAIMEEDFEQRTATKALPVVIPLKRTSRETITALPRNTVLTLNPEGSKTLKQWFTSIKRADEDRIISAVQIGLTQGEGIGAIVSRVVGTKAEGFQNGAASLTRMNVEALVRTAVNSISNAARETVFLANAGILEFLVWAATLDFRTCPICQNRDGRVAVIGERSVQPGTPLLEPQTARPPAHVRCRCVMVAAFNRKGVVERMGERPFVSGGKQQLNFRDRAKQLAGDSWKELTTEERRAAVKRVSTAWANLHIGKVPAKITYADWLETQPAHFQDEVLGKTKGKLFRTGRVTLSDFVSGKGNAITLRQLAQSNEAAFMAAGINPMRFS